MKIYYAANKEEIAIQSKIYYVANKEEIAAYNAEHKEEIAIRSKKYNAEHKEEIAAKSRERRKIDPKFKLSRNMSSGVYSSLKDGKNGRHWEDLVDYTLNDLKKHIEKHFVNGMSWGNQGEWHIDHKVPVKVFNFTKPEHDDFLKCFALSNLQPLWAEDNLKKRAKLDKHFQPSLAM